MESASKRKAASAALGDGDGRPPKRQKAPVRAAPEVLDAASVVDQKWRATSSAMRHGS